VEEKSLANFFKKAIKFNPEITNGVCPTCKEYTMLVSVTRDFFRCISCGADLEQKVNGKISYLPLNVKPFKPEDKTQSKNG
tara:strand:- start:1408 stop:1650 length:243 start_codon:yes stop_codon:yes gene_type:complete